MKYETLSEKIARVKRSTTNQDILDICQALEQLVGQPEPPKPKFDKRAYMRNYMRNKRNPFA